MIVITWFQAGNFARMQKDFELSPAHSPNQNTIVPEPAFVINIFFQEERVLRDFQNKVLQSCNEKLAVLLHDCKLRLVLALQPSSAGIDSPPKKVVPAPAVNIFGRKPKVFSPATSHPRPVMTSDHPGQNDLFNLSFQWFWIVGEDIFMIGTALAQREVKRPVFEKANPG